MRQKNIPEFHGELRKHMIRLPACIHEASGISIFGRHIQSIVFSTDIAIIRNCNADAVIAVYPFTPQPAIAHAIITSSDMPVFCGVGGGTTTGKRVVNLAMGAESQGALGVVLNAPASNETIWHVRQKLDIPVVVTVASEHTDFKGRIEAGTAIFNVSCADKTPDAVRRIRLEYPDFPVIATGGSTYDSIMRTIDAGANAITYTPPSNSEIFREIMIKYRGGL